MLTAWLTTVLTLAPSSVGAADGACPEACPLCDGPRADIVALHEAEALGAAAVLATGNLSALGAIEERRRAGGPLDDRQSARTAQLQARLRLRNWYSLVLQFTGDAEHVHEASPATVASLLGRFSEAGVFPAVRMTRLRMGRGRVCARYDFQDAEQGRTMMGGRALRYRVGNVQLEGRRRPALSLEWPSASSGSVELLLTEHFSFRLEHRLESDRRGSYETFEASDVCGGWVRRFGTHRAGGFLFWTVPPDLAREAPAAPRAGCAIYLPGLRFRLPIVPDLNFDDLRRLALPMPILRVEDLRQPRLPPWLWLDGKGGLADWAGVGEVPAPVRQRFPDR